MKPEDHNLKQPKNQEPNKTLNTGANQNKQDDNTDFTLDEVKFANALGRQPFRRIASIVINMTFVASVLTFALILISLSVAIIQWLFRLDNSITANYNWLMFVHSVLILRSHLCLRWDVYYCCEHKSKNSNLTFNFNVFAFLLVFELMLISRIILVYMPLMSLFITVFV